MDDFDKWFDNEGYDEQYRDMFSIVWNASIKNSIKKVERIWGKLEAGSDE